MSNNADAKAVDLRWFGVLSYKQVLVLVSAFLVALLLTIAGFGASCYCFGMLVIAIILYMLPRYVGIENLRLMTLVGIAFLISATLIGGTVMAPGVAEKNQGTPPENDYFGNIVYTYPGGGIDISAELGGVTDVHTVYFVYGEVKGIEFQGISAVLKTEAPLNLSGNSVSSSIQLDSGKLYAGYLKLTKNDGSGGEAAEDSSKTNWTLLTGAFDGSISKLCFYGSFIAALYIAVIFFMIMILSNIMRTRMEKTREKMEKEGRLYPQGYGRCGQCGAVVLPGEVSCRKCGTYIDRPDGMKPKKKDFFECSDCGAEVPKDAKQCPKCGAAFDEEEAEVTHADGTVEATNEVFECPECGAEVPATVSFCHYCGAKFKGRK